MKLHVVVLLKSCGFVQRFGQSGVVRRSILELIAAELLKMMTGANTSALMPPEASDATDGLPATPFQCVHHIHGIFESMCFFKFCLWVIGGNPGKLYYRLLEAFLNNFVWLKLTDLMTRVFIDSNCPLSMEERAFHRVLNTDLNAPQPGLRLCLLSSCYILFLFVHCICHWQMICKRPMGTAFVLRSVCSMGS